MKNLNANILIGATALLVGAYLLHKKGVFKKTTVIKETSSFDGGWSNCNACSSADGGVAQEIVEDAQDFKTVSPNWINETPY